MTEPIPTIITTTNTTSNQICRTILGTKISLPYQISIQSTLSSLNNNNNSTTNSIKKRPKLLGILASNSLPSISYANWTRKACELIGIEYELKILNLNQGEVENCILLANDNDEIDGIMVYVSLNRFCFLRDFFYKLISIFKRKCYLYYYYCCYCLLFFFLFLFPFSFFQHSTDFYFLLSQLFYSTHFLIQDKMDIYNH